MTQQTIPDLRALVVDDHMVVRCEIERLLKSFGVTQVEQAADVQEATDKMAAGEYNVIFLDWNMPGRSGYNLLQQCREDKSFDATAFIIVSAESEERFIIEALKAGATSYIVKPVTESILKDHVDRVVKWINQRTAEGQQQTA